MENAKKMILVPESTFLRLKKADAPQDRQLVSLDSEMQHIMGRTDLADIDKVKLYNQHLQRYLAISNRPPKTSNIKPISVEKGDLETNDNHQNATPNILNTVDQRILRSVPKIHNRKTEQLIAVMKEHPDILKWNAQGQVFFKGDPIPESNIVDLVNDLMSQRKDYSPPGWQTFLRGLTALNVPHTYIGNKSRRQMLGQIDLLQKTPVRLTTTKRLISAIKGNDGQVSKKKRQKRKRGYESSTSVDEWIPW
jgi:hypothetical protein